MSDTSEIKATEPTTNRRVLVGVVVSDKMDKTIVVEVERQILHRRYRKYVKRKNTFMAHDESNEFKTGDVVAIRESRPLSRHKRWVAFERRQTV